MWRIVQKTKFLLNRLLDEPFIIVLFYWNQLINKLYSMIVFHRTDINIFPDSRIRGTKYMEIGKNFVAGRGLWIEGIDCYKLIDTTQFFYPKLIIGNNVSLGEYVHIGCTNLVQIGNNVLMGSKVYITDHNHGVYTGKKQDNPIIPPSKRTLTTGQSVVVGDNVWIGEFVTILPGVTIGKGCVIGSHSTVTHNIPSECIAVGCPARVIKKWQESTQVWEKI